MSTSTANNTNLSQRNSLFIGDLSIFCTENDLRDLFSPFGQVVEVKIMKSEDKGRSLSYGFVKYEDPACASRAMDELQHQLLHGRNLRIAWASYKNKTGNSLSNPDNLETSAVHVSFISYQIDNIVTESSLRALFSQYGEVTDVSIKKSSVERGNVKRQSGYGFVHFPITPAGITAAILATQDLQDKQVNNVNYKSSLSHKLTEFIEENASHFPARTQMPYQPKQPKQPSPVNANLHPPVRQPVLNISANPVQPSPPMHYSLPNPPALPVQPSNLSGYQLLPVPAPHSHAIRVTEQSQSFVVAPILNIVPYPTTLSPHVEYAHFGGTFEATQRQPFPMAVPGYPVYPPMSSPAQSSGSPQYYLNDYTYTPSSITSNDIFCEGMVGNLLVSPPEGSRISEPYGFSKRSSPMNSGRPLQAHSTKLNNVHPNKNVNLKKAREKGLRNHLNDFDTSIKREKENLDEYAQPSEEG